MKLFKESLKALKQEKEDLSKQLENQQSTNENNQLLINEYKEKNDTLSGLVNKYQAYANENEEIKQTLSLERDQFETK